MAANQEFGARGPAQLSVAGAPVVSAVHQYESVVAVGNAKGIQSRNGIHCKAMDNIGDRDVQVGIKCECTLTEPTAGLVA